MHALSRHWVLNVNDFAKFRGTKGTDVVSKLARRQQTRKFLWILMKNGTGIARRAGRICVTDAGGDSSGDGGGGVGYDGDAGGRRHTEQTQL